MFVLFIYLFSNTDGNHRMFRKKIVFIQIFLLLLKLQKIFYYFQKVLRIVKKKLLALLKLTFRLPCIVKYVLIHFFC